MSNMVKIELRKEIEATVVDNKITDVNHSIFYSVYASCDELSCWIGACTDIETLEEIICPENIITSITESASEYEYDCLMAVLKHNNYKYECFNTYRQAIKNVSVDIYE